MDSGEKTSLSLKLLDTINSLIEKKAMFTAYDVTIITREKHELRIRHRECRDLIHSVIEQKLEFNWSIYKKTLVKHPVANTYVVVYHPHSEDPTQYHFRINNELEISTKKEPTNNESKVQESTNAISKCEPVQEQILSLDYRQRLVVCDFLLRQIGVNENQLVHLLVDGDKLVISPLNMDSLKCVAEEKTNTRGDLHISGTLHNKYFDCFKMFYILKNGNVLEIFQK